MPTLFANHKWQEYKSALKKAHSTLNNAVNAYYLENGTFPQCGIWDATPYGSLVCANLKENGTCGKWTLADGSPLPSDYSVVSNDCTSLWQSFQKTMQVQKVCDTHAYANGCIPRYKTREEVYRTNNPDKSDIEVNQALAGDDYFEEKMFNQGAIILNDGMIFFESNPIPHTIGVDVNGMKGPNKWGHDVHMFRLFIKDRTSKPRYLPKDHMIDKGGKGSRTLLYGKD